MGYDSGDSCIFISYRRSYSFFAGRIHDYLQNRGLCPFMDVYQLRQGYYMDELQSRIDECPYFMLVLNKGCFDDITEDAVFANEIRYAIEHKDPSNILIVADDESVLYDGGAMPSILQKLEKHQCDIITHKNFEIDMQHVIRNIDVSKLNGLINWREYVQVNGRTLLSSRSVVESQFATLENRFGKDLIDAVKEGRHFEGVQRIRKIRMSCFAASIIFNPAQNMVDDRAFDHGMLFNIFGELIRDPEFSLEIIINAPNSDAAKRAVENNMLGNSALEEYPELVFYSAYAGIIRIIEEVPEFNQAYQEKRFRYYLTDVVMHGAIFQIEYKKPWDGYDHIKYDIYSYNLVSNMDRRCTLVFRENDPENYSFLSGNYDYLKKHRYSKQDIQDNHEAWIAHLREIEEDM